MGKLYKGICDDTKVDGKWVQTYTTHDGVYNTISGSIWRGLVARIKKSANAYKQIHLGYCKTRNEAHMRWRLHKAELLQNHNSCDLPPILYIALQVLIENLQNTGYTPFVDNQRKETQ
jgi:hypothetical protein